MHRKNLKKVEIYVIELRVDIWVWQICWDYYVWSTRVKINVSPRWEMWTSTQRALPRDCAGHLGRALALLFWSVLWGIGHLDWVLVYWFSLIPIVQREWNRATYIADADTAHTRPPPAHSATQEGTSYYTCGNWTWPACSCPKKVHPQDTHPGSISS